MGVSVVINWRGIVVIDGHVVAIAERCGIVVIDGRVPVIIGGCGVGGCVDIVCNSVVACRWGIIRSLNVGSGGLVVV